MQHNARTPIGYFGNSIPVLQDEGVNKEEAEAAFKEINNAYTYLSGLKMNSYCNVLQKPKEIHITKKTANEKTKYDLKYLYKDYVILNFKHDITYLEAVYSISSAAAELGNE